MNRSCLGLGYVDGLLSDQSALEENPADESWAGITPPNVWRDDDGMVVWRCRWEIPNRSHAPSRRYALEALATSAYLQRS